MLSRTKYIGEFTSWQHEDIHLGHRHNRVAVPIYGIAHGLLTLKGGYFSNVAVRVIKRLVQVKCRSNTREYDPWILTLFPYLLFQKVTILFTMIALETFYCFCAGVFTSLGLRSWSGITKLTKTRTRPSLQHVKRPSTKQRKVLMCSHCIPHTG